MVIFRYCNIVETKIPNGIKDCSDFLGNSSPNSIFLKPVDTDEVLNITLNIILKLKTSKDCGPNSIPSNILQVHCDSICEPFERRFKYVAFTGNRS